MTLSMKKFGVVAMVAALGTFLVSAQLSSANHPRPKGATPLYVPLAVAYKQCTSSNSTHQGGVPGPSCTNFAQDSNFLTVGTPAANGAAANAIGFIRLVVKATSPEDVLITSSLSDVRCKPATSTTVCNSTNAIDGPDYSGGLTGTSQIRITDHWNGAGGTTPATVSDLPFSVPSSCVNTADTATGGTCSTSTSANAVVTGAVGDAKQGNVEIQTLQVFDGGSAGIGGGGVVPPPPGATRFMTQGIFIP
jgi:hypothetical protein